MLKETTSFNTSELSFDDFKAIVINDYRIACESRQASVLGRKEVLTGKAKFGIFGDGKEVAQLAMAKAFRAGDWRSGYYRDQTFAFATGMSNLKEFFAQLYAHPDPEKEPASAGRQMNSHYASRLINPDGTFKKQTDTKNTTSDISSTGGQMARMVGLALASKLYRNNPDFAGEEHFSVNGNEVAFGTIGNASTSEGVFFEAFNAAGVLQIPMAISIWDDAYGISVPAKYQTTKEDISEVLKGFQRDEKGEGFEIFKVRGWDYVGLCETYERAIDLCRREHVPVLIHVTEMTQPQGHSSSGSHQRYKSKERLEWENEFDCLLKMREWMVESAIATNDELDQIEHDARQAVADAKKDAWTELRIEIDARIEKAAELIAALGHSLANETISGFVPALKNTIEAGSKDIAAAARKAILLSAGNTSAERDALRRWYEAELALNRERYNTRLFSDTPLAPSRKMLAPVYADDAKQVDGREVLNACFDANFSRDKSIVAFGEDLGLIGDVNQGFAGLQQKYGEMRITDTGIREATIIGQGIGLSLRGLKPIAEIQYIDYLVFALFVITDDLASLSYRTKAGQKAPMLIRTRGHRLEGIWHSGSPMQMILGAMRGVHICVPRNMTQAAGMYNNLLRGDEPALIVESLNGYRLKEKMPENVGDFIVPIGRAEIVREGRDITIVSYGSTLRIVEEAAVELEKLGISAEIIDPQTLMPFDEEQLCAASLKKTSKLLVVDEDVPGGASAYILQQILEGEKGYYSLDSEPRTISAAHHRPPYGTDGDYFSKPNLEDIVEMVYGMMHESNPERYPL
ncbi:MAG: transketolase [Mucilaginibacter polytrichastri]|nr:transketolase [Mucilaginibacter polytrichastri]